MHIAIDARAINSGTGTYQAKLLEHLQRLDSTNRYTVLMRSADLGYWQPSSDNFTVLAADYDSYSLAEQLGYKRLLDDLRPDLVHFCMPQQPLRYRGKRVTTVLDLTLLRSRVSVTNGLRFRLKQLVGGLVWKRIARTSDRVIAISENTRREYQAFTGIPDTRISVVPLAAEVAPGVPEPHDGLPFEEFILYVGQQAQYKNIRRLVAAHQRLLDDHPGLGLVLVGRDDPDVAANRSWVAQEGFRNVQFTGYLPDGQRDWLFAHARTFVFPSLMEGFGLPPLEAMAHGTPVVSSNASCMPEVLGDAALYFDPHDERSMAAAIAEVITDDVLRADLVARGHRQVAAYSWQRTAEQTHAIYLAVLGS